MQYIFIPEEQKLIPYKHAPFLNSLVEWSVPYKKKKQVLLQEGGEFIQDLLPLVISTLVFL